MTRVVARYPVLAFVVIACAISWAIWSPLIAGRAAAWGLYFAGVIGPAVAAFLCAISGSDITLAALLRRITHWRVSAFWYATAILLPFAICAVAVAGAGFSEVVFRPADAITSTAFLMVLLVPFEEIGWRGYLLPLLQQRYSPLLSSVLVGGVWGLWHFPLAWASVGYQRTDEPFRYLFFFVVTIFPISCLATWLFNRTGESVLVVSLFHIAVNLADFVLLLPPQAGERILLTGSIITTLVVAIVWRTVSARN